MHSLRSRVMALERRHGLRRTDAAVFGESWRRGDAEGDREDDVPRTHFFRNSAARSFWSAI